MFQVMDRNTTRIIGNMGEDVASVPTLHSQHLPDVEDIVKMKESVVKSESVDKKAKADQESNFDNEEFDVESQELDLKDSLETNSEDRTTVQRQPLTVADHQEQLRSPPDEELIRIPEQQNIDVRMAEQKIEIMSPSVRRSNVYMVKTSTPIIPSLPDPDFAKPILKESSKHEMKKDILEDVTQVQPAIVKVEDEGRIPDREESEMSPETSGVSTRKSFVSKVFKVFFCCANRSEGESTDEESSGREDVSQSTDK